MSAQSLQALAGANEIRLEGARLRREMGAMHFAASRRQCAKLLLNPPDSIARMRVGRLLMGVHRLGQVKGQRMLSLAGLPPAAWEYRVGPRTTRRGMATL